jgi:YidC/Oxa1 family membrane protein insertase
VIPLADILQPLEDGAEAILDFFHDDVGFTWGTSIIAMTFVIRAVLIPLTYRQIKGMRALQALQPQIKEIQEKFKNDRQRMQQEMMRFYQQNKVNPFSACVPLLAQLPVFITLFYAVYTPATGTLAYVNAGQNPPLIRRRSGRFERLTGTGVALGMFDRSTYATQETHLEPGELLVLYSDGITEAENPAGLPLEEAGLQAIVDRDAGDTPANLGARVIRAVEAYARASRFADDLTILILKRDGRKTDA